MNQSTNDTVKHVMSDVLNLDFDAIRNDTSMSNTPLWDSANHIQLVLALEEEFSITFEVTEFEAMLSFADIVQAVQSKIGGQPR